MARVFNLAVAVLLGYALFRILKPFFGPILWALLAAFLLFPVNQRLRRALKGRLGLAAAILTFAVTLGIVIPAALATVAFARQAVELGQSLSQTANRHQISGVEDILALPWIGNAMDWLQKRFSLDTAQIRSWVVQAGQGILQFLVSHSRDVLFGAFGIVGNLVLMLFILFFFFRDGDRMAETALRLIPLDPNRKGRLARHLGAVTRAVVFGTVVTALIQGTLLGIAFRITGLPSPVVFGALGTIASFIPMVGTSLVWVPATLYLLAQGVLWKAIFMAAWGAVVVGVADNLLRPLLVSGQVDMGALTVFIGVLGGLAAFGLIGLFLGPLILALALALIRFAEESQAERAGTLSPGS